MEFSPSKRRKTSPTTSLPLDAPTTPSRIPVRKDGAITPRSRRPSFASPTKASLARHNPQLLKRTPPAAAVVAPTIAPGSRGRNLDEVFARALEKARPSIEAGNSNLGDEGTDGSTTQENEPIDEHPFFNTQVQPTPRTLGGALPAKPRRTSRSPFKQSPTKAFQTLVDSGELSKANPFQKTGLRRSPVGAAQEAPVLQQSPFPNDNTKHPFQKTGLRRSPILSREEPMSQDNTNPFGKKELRRSPVRSQEAISEKRVLRSSPVALQDGPLENDAQHDIQETPNPFKKRDLRRSPVIVQESIQQENINPFHKRGLARSPISSQPLAPLRQGSVQPEVSTTPTEPPPRTLVLEPSLEVDQDFDQQIQQQMEQETGLELEQEDEAILPQVPSDQESSKEMVPRPILSDHPILTDPEFSRAVEDALRSSSPVQYQASSSFGSPDPFKISQVSETEANSRDSTSFSQAIEAALSSSPSRRSGHSSLPVSQLLLEPSEVPREPERQPSPEIPLLNSLVADSISQSQQPPRKSAQTSLLRSPARRRGRTASPEKQSQPRQSSQLFRSSRLRFTEPEEPELPPTPTQLGIDDPIVTTPPTGIHDTPGRRARRNKTFGEKLKSSPLKPQDPPPLAQKQEQEQIIEKDVRHKTKSKSKQRELVQRRKSARFLTPKDPHASIKHERDALLRELQQLQADIALANKETERLHLEETRKSRPAGQEHAEELLAVLLRSTAPEQPPGPGPKISSIFKTIGSFLPFSCWPKQQSSATFLEKPILSHLPIALDDPLPYLQAFSPLVYSSNITTSTPEQDPDASLSTERATLQHHHITASHPSGMFHARLEMTVDSSIPSIISLDISKLDANSDKELGTFLRSRCSDLSPFNKDIGVVCWSMGRWVEVSLARARFWCTIEHEFGTPEARSKSLQSRKKRKLAKTHDSASREAADEEDARRVWTKKQLLPHMGRSALELAADDAELRFDWSLGFDWTGEIETSISASVRVPEDCKYPCSSIKSMVADMPPRANTRWR